MELLDQPRGPDRGRGVLKPDFSGVAEPLGVCLPNSAFGGLKVVAFHWSWWECSASEIGRCYKSGLLPSSSGAHGQTFTTEQREFQERLFTLALGIPGKACP